MSRHVFIYGIAILLVLLGPCAASQENPIAGMNTSHEILVRLGPAGSKEKDKKALDLVIRLFESEKIQVDSGVKVSDLSRERCGRLDKNWIKAFLKKNPSLTEETITSSITVVVPPCPFWRRAGQVTIPNGGTLGHQLLAQMGTIGKTTLGSVARRNRRSIESLNWVQPGEELQLPYATAFSPYLLKAGYRVDPQRAKNLIKSIPGYVESQPRREMSLITAASDSECKPPSSNAEWPFSASNLRSVLEYNNAKRPASQGLRKAVIAIADTGIDRKEDRLFLEVNDRESPTVSSIDNDENGYVDDYWGANMDKSVPGFPALPDGYRYSDHGTHVAGIALGGLRDPQLTGLIKERVALRIINIVRKEVQQIGSGEPITSFSIPNDYLLDAIQYAQADAQVINLSVESENESGLEPALKASTAIVVVAAGNDTTDIDENPRYPAAAKARDRLIAVAAYDDSGGMAGFSNWGSQLVDVAAPGCQIDSVLPNGKRGKLNGTSQAAPLVSFTAALLYSEGLTIPQIKNRILLTTDMDHAKLGMDCARPTGGCVVSEGRLNIVRALQVYQDVMVRQEPDGSRVVMSGRIQDPCISLSGKCYDLRGQLKRLVHEVGSNQGKVWIKSANNTILSKSCEIGNFNISFSESESSEPRPIPISQIVDLVPAQFQEDAGQNVKPQGRP